VDGDGFANAAGDVHGGLHFLERERLPAGHVGEAARGSVHLDPVRACCRLRTHGFGNFGGIAHPAARRSRRCTRAPGAGLL
jgi:hypothetical protein